MTVKCILNNCTPLHIYTDIVYFFKTNIYFNCTNILICLIPTIAFDYFRQIRK